MADLGCRRFDHHAGKLPAGVGDVVNASLDLLGTW